LGFNKQTLITAGSVGVNDVTYNIIIARYQLKLRNLYILIINNKIIQMYSFYRNYLEVIEMIKMKAVFLVINYMPHQLVSIKTLINDYNATVHSFSFKDNTPIPENVENLKTYRSKDFSRTDLLKKIIEIKADLIVVAGWAISDYMWVAKQIRKKTNVPIIAMSDTQWLGTFRQKINCSISPFHVGKAFTHIWVAGIRQYDYARRLGFSNNQIIFNCLSADTELFSKVILDNKHIDYPRNFLYIGRFTEVKGLKNLMQAWSSIEDKKGWTFTLIGSGEMKSELADNGNFIVKDYMPQDLLLEEMKNTGCFVLPSIKEPWALVIHEAASAGLPLLCTETCGATPHFLINNYNGYLIENNSIEDLKSKLELIIGMDEFSLLEFGANSRKLSERITPEIQTASLLQLIKE